MLKDRKSSRLIASLDNIPETSLVPAKYLAGGSIGAKIAYGLESSMMVAVRQPGYHSRPHTHDAEQLNYVLDGELLVFVDDAGFLARKDDIFRIPRNSVHWSWVQGDRPCVLLESHAPALIGDFGVLDTAVGLLEDSEGSPTGYVESNWPTEIDQASVELRVVGRSAE